MESFEPADSVAPTDVVDSWLREGRGFRRAFLKMAWGSMGDPRRFFEKPKLKQKITLSKELTERKIWDELPAYNPPRDCIQPPKDAYVQCAVWPWHSFSVLAWPQIPSAALLKRPSFFFFSKQTVKADF